MKNRMTTFLRRCSARLTAFIMRRLLYRRYRTRVIGVESVPRHRGYLILGNHPAELDPLLFTATLWEQFEPRSVILKDFYVKPYAHWLFFISNCIPIPDLEVERNRASVQEVKQGLNNVIETIHQGGNVLLYPSGRLYRAGREAVGNASGLHLLLKRDPDMPILLMRTRGFWGSSFSCADGPKPDLGKALVNAILSLFVNFFFFCPHRDITLEFEVAPPDFPRHADRPTLNRWLDDWFNRPGDEPLTRIPYRWWQRAKA